MKGSLEAAKLAAKYAMHMVLEEMEWSRATKVDYAVQQAIAQHRSLEQFTVLLDDDVGLEMTGLIFQFKLFNLDQKLNLNFASDLLPLSDGVTEEVLEEYEEEDAYPPIVNNVAAFEEAANAEGAMA